MTLTQSDMRKAEEKEMTFSTAKKEALSITSKFAEIIEKMAGELPSSVFMRLEDSIEKAISAARAEVWEKSCQALRDFEKEMMESAGIIRAEHPPMCGHDANESPMVRILLAARDKENL